MVGFEQALVAQRQPLLTLDQGFVVHFDLARRYLLRRVDPVAQPAVGVGKIPHQLLAQRLQVLDGVAVDILEARQSGPVPARQVVAIAHPPRPPCRVSR
ncbi:hypothetical protein [Accumulibacter sp.]|uniref:hypothetical protein n=1 Tax=Accumulibacter sp. TaxID=2053492 RepID=UPI00261EE0B9|nr:hypothetical protein [Accumulibacter sp.]